MTIATGRIHFPLYTCYNVLHFAKRKREGRSACRRNVLYDGGPAIGGRMLLRIERRLTDYRVTSAKDARLFELSSQVERVGEQEGNTGENSRRAPDSLLEGNTYYRFWDETGRVIPVRIMTNV